MKMYLLLFATILLAACQGNKSQPETGSSTAADTTANEVYPAATADSIPSPAGLTKLGETTGDLDKDGKEEKAIVYDTKRETEMGTERELHIFKSNNGQWELWHKAIGPVMPSQNGGMMGDPFQEMTIENGTLVLNHFGGSRSKWTFTHRYRFQDAAWKLIGATTNTGSPCDYWENYDYNLSTGKINYKKEVEDCSKSEDNPTITKTTKDFTNKPKSLPAMDGFHPGENEVKLAKMEEAFYY